MKPTVKTTGPGDHGDRHRVHELLLGQLAKLGHHAAVQEGHNRQARTENECAGFGEENVDLLQQRDVHRAKLSCSNGYLRKANRMQAASLGQPFRQRA